MTVPFFIFTVATVTAQGARAVVLPRATSRTTTGRRRSIASGIIAAIVVSALVGIALLVICCWCGRRFLRRRRTAGHTHAAPPMTSTASPWTQGSTSMNQGGAAVPGHISYGPPPGPPPQAYNPGAKNGNFVGGFINHDGAADHPHI